MMAARQASLSLPQRVISSMVRWHPSQRSSAPIRHNLTQGLATAVPGALADGANTPAGDPAMVSSGVRAGNRGRGLPICRRSPVRHCSGPRFWPQ